MRARLPLVALALVAALVAAGCRSKSKPTPTGAQPAASLVVTRDFGAGLVVRARVAPGQTVMTALRTAAKVETRSGGTFVRSIDGVGESLGGGRFWLYYVNGIESERGAVDEQVRNGDRVWWDRRPWSASAYPSVPVVVGSFPEPFVHGFRGHRPAVRVTGSPALAAALRVDGARLTGGATRWRVAVGADAALRRDPAYRRAADDPQGAGAMAALRGGRVVLFDGDGLEPVPGARAAVFAVRVGQQNGDGALLAVAGVDAASARAAAAAIARRPALLDGRYAAALDGQGRVVASAGRS